MAQQGNVNSNSNNNPVQAMLGMNMDGFPQQIKPGTLTYALNAQIESFDGNMITYQNEQSNVLCSEFKVGYRVIGFHSIPEQSRTVVFLANPTTGDSEIGLLDNNITVNVDDNSNLNLKKSSNYVNNGYNNLSKECNCEGSPEILTFYEMYKKLHPDLPLTLNSCCNYTTLINAKCLNFNVNYPIHKAVHRIVDLNDDANKCGTEVYWADGLNARRFLNIDDLPFADVYLTECEKVKSNVIDCDLMDVQPRVSIPIVTPVVVTDGGSTVAGTYQFSAAYANDKAEIFTSYFGVTNPVGVFRSRYGLDYNFETDKTIKLLITNLDTKYKYFNLAVIKTINGITSVELVGTYDILKSTSEISYTGENKTPVKLTINDIFQQYPYYKTAQNVNVVNDVIMWSDLKSPKRLSYQSVANKIKLQWMSVQLPYNAREGYSNGVNTALYKGYMRDEVYALEVRLLIKGGRKTDGFHIPAREAVSSDLTMISNDDVLIGGFDVCTPQASSQPKWKVYNTGSLTGTFPEYTNATNKDCYKGPYQYGEFAYWESEKKYPCNTKIWGALAGKPIRHHKFPDSVITHVHDLNATVTDKEFEHKVFPLGIKVDVENIRQAILTSDLTDEQKTEIVGYEIIRSDRVNNKSVIAKGLLYNVGVYTPYSEGTTPAANQQVFYPNYPFNDLGADPFLTNLSSVSENSVGFNIYTLDDLQSTVETTLQNLDTVAGSLVNINGACYTATTTCALDPSGTVLVTLSSSDKLDVENKIFTARNDGQNLLDAIQVILDAYNAKVQSGGIICQTDLVAMTLNPALVIAFRNSVNAVTGSIAWSDFQAAINQINANSTTLSANASANDIFNLRSTLMTAIKTNTDLNKQPALITASNTAYTSELTDLSTLSCTGTSLGTSAFSSSRFTFHSPDTHFYQPFLGSILKFETVEGGPSTGNFVQVRDHAGHKLMSAFSSGLALVAGIAVGALFALEPRAHQVTGVGFGYTVYYPDFPSLGTIAEKALYWNQQFKLLIDNLLPEKNYAYQYNAVGYYNNFNKVPNTGNKQRVLDKAYYLNPGLQTLGDIYPVNNWRRESSVYFRVDKNVAAPLLPNNSLVKGSLTDDNSRVTYSDAKQIYSNVLSYYASNKRRLDDQYGDIYSYGVVETGFSGLIDITKDYTGVHESVFGGDIFINRFGLKRKLSYFLDTAVGRNNGADISYSNLSNIGKVKYWYNSSSAQTPGSGFKGLMKSLLGVPQSNLDGNSNKLFYQDGRIYLYSYGISYFFVESEVNTDFRQAGNDRDKDFFPNMGTGIPNEWLQEVNVPITHDNYYIYNKTYSKQNKEAYVPHLPISFDSDQECQQDYTHRVMYSDPNKWRIYKPISFYDFPKTYGKLTSLDTLTNSQILARFENKTYLHNALTAIQTSSGKYAYLGNDDVFKGQSMDFGDTDYGYAGSQHKLLLKTEAGDLFIDSARTQVFLVKGTAIESISDNGIAKWLSHNLDFKISTYFSEVNIDNAYNGVGLTGVWDNQFSRFLITKLDYEPIPELAKDITYDSYYGKYYYKNQEILLEDNRYFLNRCWTLSYHPESKSWISFHSYLPNYYIGLNGLYLTGVNGSLSNQMSSVWIHNLVHTSYQRYYGKLEPYILEYPVVYKAQDEILQSVKDYTTILEYYNVSDFYEINDNVYFNKAILYNNQQCSGVLNLYPKPKGKLHEYFKYPLYKADSKDIIFTKSDNYFNYNTFWDVVKNPNNHYPLWTESVVNKSIMKDLNNSFFDYSRRSHQKTKLRAKDLKIRHINDYHDRYKFISKFMLAQTQVSFK